VNFIDYSATPKQHKLHIGFAFFAKPNHNHPMQLQLDDVALFARIAQLGSLSAAARERDVPVSQVTRSLARLEAQAQVRLLHRTTHGLSLTDEGDTFLAYGRKLLDTRAELAAELSGKVQGPSGWVRVSVSPVIAQMVIAPSLQSLHARYPQLQIDINAEDRVADMARDGIDVAIRTGQLTSDTLVARQIGDFGRVLVASPAYIKRFGKPKTLADLAQHRIIANSASPLINHWPLKAARKNAKPAGKPSTYDAVGHTRTDNSGILMALIREGAGIARLMDILAAPLIQSGDLVPLLQTEFDDQRTPIYAVMLQERHRLPKVRACIDHWAAWLARITAMAKTPTGKKRWRSCSITA
jgi:DNA-binding transcriptional LysR family regulator